MRQGEYFAEFDYPIPTGMPEPDDYGTGWCVRVLLNPRPDENGYDSEPVAQLFEDQDDGNGAIVERRAHQFAAAPELEAACVAAFTVLGKIDPSDWLAPGACGVLKKLKQALQKSGHPLFPDTE